MFKKNLIAFIRFIIINEGFTFLINFVNLASIIFHLKHCYFYSNFFIMITITTLKVIVKTSFITFLHSTFSSNH